MGWRGATSRDLVVLALIEGPGTVKRLVERIDTEAWLRSSRGRTTPNYQTVYSRLLDLQCDMWVDRHEVRGERGWVWWLRTPTQRLELIEDLRENSLPSDSERELAAELAAEAGVDIELRLEEQPDLSYSRPRWWGLVVVRTGRGEARRAAPMGTDRPNWQRALEAVFDP